MHKFFVVIPRLNRYSKEFYNMMRKLRDGLSMINNAIIIIIIMAKLRGAWHSE